MDKKIRALFTFEILGRPPEHIKSTMEQLIDKLGEIPGISIDRREVHEPKPVEDENAEDLFTTFSEVEILGDSVDNLITIVFHAMPSHVEIIEPEEFGFKNFDITNILSSLTAKLHNYDEIAKSILIERNMLVAKLNEMQKRLKELEGDSPEIEKKIIVKEFTEKEPAKQEMNVIENKKEEKTAKKKAKQHRKTDKKKIAKKGSKKK